MSCLISRSRVGALICLKKHTKWWKYKYLIKNFWFSHCNADLRRGTKNLSFAFHDSLAFGNGSGGTCTSSTLSAAEQALELLASGAPGQSAHCLYFQMDRQGSWLIGPPRPPQSRRKAPLALARPSPSPSPSLNCHWTINCGSSSPQGQPHARSLFLPAARGFPIWPKKKWPLLGHTHISHSIGELMEICTIAIKPPLLS